MRMIFALAAAICSLVLVSAASPTRASGPDVIRDPAQLQALFSGKTLYGRFLSGDRFMEYYSPDGRTAYMQLQCLHAGTWWIETLREPFGVFEAGTPIACFNYPTLNAADEASCFAVGGARGSERFYPIGGDPTNTGIPGAIVNRWVPGNVEPLPLDEDNCPSA